VSAKRIRLDGSLTRRVHFNDNPVSDSVEIPRIPDGKHTRKKLQMSGYDQEMFISRLGVGSDTMESDTQDSCHVNTETPVSASTNAVFPELVDSTESISTIIHNLANGTWAKVLEADLKQHKVITVGQLARMNSIQVRALRGVKPDKEVTVKNVLKGLWSKVKKDEGVVRIRAPVEEETTQEEEEEIKAALFSRPSPSPTDMGDLDNAGRDIEEEIERIEKTGEKEEMEVVKTNEDESRSIVEETQSLQIVEDLGEDAQIKSPRKSPRKSPVKGEGWSLNIEDTPAKKTEEAVAGSDISDLEVNVGSESISSTESRQEVVIPVMQAQDTNTPVQSISPDTDLVKAEPGVNLANMAEVVDTEIDLTTLASSDLRQLYGNLEQHRNKVNQLMSKVHMTMLDKMDTR
jgi:hypothetical protein